jgi:hypothetical protein
MSISLKTHKLLWGRSGGKCAICKNPLMTFSEDDIDDPSIIGEEAHIIGRKKDAARGTDMRLALGERDVFSNLILLCRNHHKEIDDKENEYTVDRLLEIKETHEKEVAESQSTQSKRQLELEVMYAGVVDKWVNLSKLDNWKDVSSNLCGDTASFPKDWLDSMEKCCEWLFSRVWDDEFSQLRDSFTNFRLVARDL